MDLILPYLLSRPSGKFFNQAISENLDDLGGKLLVVPGQPAGGEQLHFTFIFANADRKPMRA